MSSETETRKRIVKPSTSGLYKTKIIAFVAIIFIAIFSVASIASIINTEHKNKQSSKLVATINALSKTQTCNEGLATISLTASDLENNKTYTDVARERALEYLMACNQITGNSTKALSYSSQLEALYKADGNTQKKQQVIEYAQYIKRTQNDK